MKLLGSILIVILITFKVDAQDTLTHHQYTYSNNSIFVEALGNAYLFGSLNYEHAFVKLNKFYLDGRIGIGYGNAEGRILSLPIGFNGIFQIYQAFAWEVGIGLTLMDVERGDANPRNSVQEYEGIPALVANTGLRIQDKDGFLFRLDFTPFYNLNHTGQLLPPQRFSPWAGISFGYRIGGKRKMKEKIEEVERN